MFTDDEVDKREDFETSSVANVTRERWSTLLLHWYCDDRDVEFILGEAAATDLVRVEAEV